MNPTDETCVWLFPEYGKVECGRLRIDSAFPDEPPASCAAATTACMKTGIQSLTGLVEPVLRRGSAEELQTLDRTRAVARTDAA